MKCVILFAGLLLLLLVSPLQSQTLTFTTNGNGLATAIFNGTNYNYIYGEQLLTAVVINGTQYYAPSCTGSFTSTTITQTCTANGDSFNVVVTYSNPTPDAIQASISFKNNAATDSVDMATFSTLGLSLPAYDGTTPPVVPSESNQLELGSFVTGRFAIWNNAPSANVMVNSAIGCPTCKFQPSLLTVVPGQTAVMAFTMRLTSDLTSAPNVIAPEAYAAYAASYPNIVNWPDRRPISAWFSADHSHQSALNPRGYLNDPTLDVSNISAFVTKMVAAANTIVNTIQARPVQPQGIVWWDLEGQEFVQSTTYIGDPRILSQGYSPEMDAAADQVFTIFKNAGLKVGLTLRPNYMMWGLDANLPATCTTNVDPAYRDYYISVDGPYQANFHNCFMTNTWGINPSGNGSQTVYLNTQAQQVIDLLKSKIDYARARWGTTIYYVDSTVWVGGAPIQAAIFRALQTAYPDTLFIPEESYLGYAGVTTPYATFNGQDTAEYAPPAWRYSYPYVAVAQYLSNCSIGSCFTNHSPGYTIGQQLGDIAFYSVPGQLSAQGLTNLEGMIQQGRANGGVVVVTDSATSIVRNYNGNTVVGFAYPQQMRVYFSDTIPNMTGSTNYCANGQYGGQNFCTLNLTGVNYSQIRYYDFTGNLTQSNTIQPLSSGSGGSAIGTNTTYNGFVIQ